MKLLVLNSITMNLSSCLISLVDGLIKKESITILMPYNVIHQNNRVIRKVNLNKKYKNNK